MNVSDKSMTLRAQEHGHQPIVCFEPMSMKEENWVQKRNAAALRAGESKSARAVCMERIGNPVIYPGISITSPQNGNNPQPGDPCPTLTDDSKYYLVGKSECVTQPPITGAFMGGQGAKARSIAWCEDGTTPTLKSAPSGGNTVPDIVYPINLMVATRGGRDDMRTCFGIGRQNEPQFTLSSAHEHAVFYEVNPDG